MAYISDALRQLVVQRARGLCEYCQTPQVIVVTMEIDHIKPESEDGKTVPDNLALSCIGCNGFKLAYQTGIDPLTQQEVPLFNPRVQRWSDHFRWSEDGTQVIGLTSIARATVDRLRVNREEIVNARQLWVQAGWHPPREL